MILNQGPDWGHVIYYSMTQMSMKSGVEIFVTRGVNAVSIELKQLHLSFKIESLDPHTLSKEEYNEVLQSYLFLIKIKDNTHNK